MGKYDDIIHLPHHVSSKHLPMPMQDRAAQFSPFWALTGYEASIAESARKTEEKPELSENRKKELDERLQLLKEALLTEPEIAVTYFVPDSKKRGGAYVQVTGIVKKLDDFEHALIMKDGTTIPIHDILEMESSVFEAVDF